MVSSFLCSRLLLPCYPLCHHTQSSDSPYFSLPHSFLNSVPRCPCFLSPTNALLCLVFPFPSLESYPPTHSPHFTSVFTFILLILVLPRCNFSFILSLPAHSILVCPYFLPICTVMLVFPTPPNAVKPVSSHPALPNFLLLVQ